MASESGLGAEKDLEHELARAFASAEFNGATLTDSLRESIRRFVDEAKTRGASANDVVAAMKDIARRAGFARPDTARPLASFPADRLFTRAITACLETYETEETSPPPTPVSSHDASHDPQLDLGAFRALLSSNNEEDFARSVARYVRSAHARGLSMDQVLLSVSHIMSPGADAVSRLGGDAVLHSHQLVIRGLLLAVYSEGTGDAASAGAVRPAEFSPLPRSDAAAVLS